MSKKREVIKRTCKFIAENGKGVVDYKGNDLHVPLLLKGEVADIEVINGGRHKEPEILKFYKESNESVEPKCPYYFECGGCQLQHMSTKAQNEFKYDTVKHFLGRFGNVEKLITMKNPYYYRNKVHSTFATTQKGKIVSGLYEENTHSIIPIEKCIIQDPIADDILDSIRKIFKKYKMRTYDEYSRKGFLRHVLIRTGYKSREVMVVFVVAHKKFYSRSKIIKELTHKHPEIKSIIMNINDKKTSMVLGDYEKVIYGKPYIEDTLCGLDFKISSSSFYQINPVQTEKLYRKALAFANIKKTDIVLDTYCGIGTIGLIAASQAKQVYGVEINPDAVQKAKQNANDNQIENAEFYQADASDFMRDVSKSNETVDIVIMDPPRSGSDEKFLSALRKLAPKKIVYVSCNPKTQRRDLIELTNRGYKVDKIQPVDMFPQTYHVETVCLLTRQ